jgi:hypothetical protein
VAYLTQNRTGKFLVTGDLNKQKNSFQYEVDFDKVSSERGFPKTHSFFVLKQMTEINTHYRRNPRPIRRDPRDVSATVKWEFQHDGKWHAFDLLATNTIEMACKEGKVPYVNVTWKQKDIRVYFSPRKYATFSDKPSMQLAIRRSNRDYEADFHKSRSQPEESTEFNLTETVPETTTIEYISVTPSALIGAQNEVTALMRSLETTSSVPIGNLSPAQRAEIEKIAKSNHVEITISDGMAGLKGLQVAVINARQEIMEFLLKNAQSETVSFPKTWEKQSNNCELKLVAKDSPEWNEVLKRMRETLPSIVIHQIERVQNKWLWEKYSAQRNILHKKRNGVINEYQLFHGTRQNPPANIYNGEHGFDMRYCTSGMWGIAIYFAWNASYSNSYRSTTPNGQFQMFLARVLVGECVDMPSDGSLRKPPAKAQNQLGFIDDYDSVSGTTGGSKVFMIYENGRAYPEYLITYTA